MACDFDPFDVHQVQSLSRSRRDPKLLLVNGSINFEFVKKIGQGTHGKVSIYQSNGQTIVIKEYDKPAEAEMEWDIYTAARRQCKDDLIPAMISEDRKFLLMQHACGTLNDLFEFKLDEKHLHQIFLSVLTAITCLAKLGYYYTDLKPANILYDKKYKVFLGDFGSAPKQPPWVATFVPYDKIKGKQGLGIFQEANEKTVSWVFGVLMLSGLLGPKRVNETMLSYDHLRLQPDINKAKQILWNDVGKLFREAKEEYPKYWYLLAGLLDASEEKRIPLDVALFWLNDAATKDEMKQVPKATQSTQVPKTTPPRHTPSRQKTPLHYDPLTPITPQRDFDRLLEEAEAKRRPVAGFDEQPHEDTIDLTNRFSWKGENYRFNGHQLQKKRRTRWFKVPVDDRLREDAAFNQRLADYIRERLNDSSVYYSHIIDGPVKLRQSKVGTIPMSLRKNDTRKQTEWIDIEMGRRAAVLRELTDGHFTPKRKRKREAIEVDSRQQN